MRIKTFYARTMAEALRDIKAELGPDALLLSTKEKPSRSGGETTVEVVAAADNCDGVELFRGPAKAPRASQGSNPAAVDGPDRAPAEADPDLYTPASLRGIPGQATSTTKRTAQQRASTAAVLYRDLVTAGVHAWLARRLVRQSVRMLDVPRRRHRAALLSALNSLSGGLISGATGKNFRASASSRS